MHSIAKRTPEYFRWRMSHSIYYIFPIATMHYNCFIWDAKTIANCISSYSCVLLLLCVVKLRNLNSELGVLRNLNYLQPAVCSRWGTSLWILRLILLLLLLLLILILRVLPLLLLLILLLHIRLLLLLLRFKFYAFALQAAHCELPAAAASSMLLC